MCVCVCAAASHFLSFEKYVPSSSLYIHVCGIKVTWYNRRKSVFPNGGGVQRIIFISSEVVYYKSVTQTHDRSHKDGPYKLYNIIIYQLFIFLC